MSKSRARSAPGKSRLFIATAWRFLRGPVWLGLGLLVGFAVPWLAWLDREVRQTFTALEHRQPTRVFARPLHVAPGLPLSADTLLLELAAARYSREPNAPRPGTYDRDGDRFLVYRRAFADSDGEKPAQRFGVRLIERRVADLRDADGRPLADTWLDPARIATLYEGRAEERRPLELEQVPELVLTTLQAVEDRDFKHHRGLDPLGILRAAIANLRAGRLSQGGSTITQQLVRHLYLDRHRSWLRKANEAAMAVIIEARFDKRDVLQAYLNEVYLGQHGAQAIHGFGAASEFWFGRGLDALQSHEIALLVGMIRGPSFYDPRRFPERARARRDRVLAQMAETGLIDGGELDRARASPLGLYERPGLPRNRHPAFLDMVQQQLVRDFTRATRRGGGLSVHTTLAPSVQTLAERALSDALAELDGDAVLQGALVVTDADSGEVLALVGDRRADQHGFNRAVNARRPVGSLIKPFVYLLALAEPSRFHLATPLDDGPLSLRLPNGQVWSPTNADRQHRGMVPLIEALSRSYNVASVRLGLEVGPRRVLELLRLLAPELRAEAHPSLLLGAADLSPLQVAQAYQFLAAGGRPLPLRAVRSVVDSDDRPLSRYSSQPGSSRHAAAVPLVSIALQEAALAGTARALASGGLLALRPAGKTGTSNDQRDSWFAGYTGSHLAVVWVGRDDNQPTGLMGATGAMRVWSGLFLDLPGLPLFAERSGAALEWAWVSRDGLRRSQPDCPGARELPFLAGHVPQGEERCPLSRLGRRFQ
jgi:penicillin-binding protein 1B